MVRAGSSGLVIMGVDSFPRGREFESQRFIQLR